LIANTIVSVSGILISATFLLLNASISGTLPTEVATMDSLGELLLTRTHGQSMN
jgi:hypothetical protein